MVRRRAVLFTLAPGACEVEKRVRHYRSTCLVLTGSPVRFRRIIEILEGSCLRPPKQAIPGSGRRGGSFGRLCPERAPDRRLRIPGGRLGSRPAARVPIEREVNATYRD